MDEAGENTVSTQVAEPLAAWLDDLAEGTDRSRQEVLDRLLAAFHTVESDDGAPPDPERIDDLERRVEGLSGDVDELSGDVASKVQDVRERVVQVKREADGKAPADHGHADLRERAATATDSAAATEDAVDSLRSRLDALQEQTREGFANYEDILEYLTDEADTLDRKVRTLARATVDLRDGVQNLAAADGRRRAVEQLRRAASNAGVRTADCGECGAPVDVALLTEPACPHCGSTFADVEPARGFFGSATLAIGESPALDAGEEESYLGGRGVELIADSEPSTAPDTGAGTGDDDGTSDDAGADGSESTGDVHRTDQTGRP